MSNHTAVAIDVDLKVHETRSFPKQRVDLGKHLAVLPARGALPESLGRQRADAILIDLALLFIFDGIEH